MEPEVEVSGAPARLLLPEPPPEEEPLAEALPVVGHALPTAEGESRLCANPECGKSFVPHPRKPTQAYGSTRGSKWVWQRTKRAEKAGR